MAPAEHRRQRAIGGADLDADDSADFVVRAPHARGMAQQRDVRNGRQRHRRVVLQIDFAVVVNAAYRAERTRHGLRSEIAVGTEDDASDAERGGFQLEAGESSHAVSALTNVGPKEQRHGQPPFKAVRRIF